jgi:2,4-dienoyl-CoA reductase (NADPH2)
MQILHSGRYGYHPFAVAPSPIKSPIGMFTPSGLSHQDVLGTIDDYARCARLAAEAGYDGVEIMGSEGYLLNQFIATRTNKRTDAWGGSYENRTKLALEVVRRTRAEVNKDFIVVFRLSMMDLVDGGSSWPEVVALAKDLEAAGVDIINTVGRENKYGGVRGSMWLVFPTSGTS